MPSANEPMGPGVKPDILTLGWTWLDTSGTSAVLGSNVSTGDGNAQGRAVEAWLNKNGGIAGRKVRLRIDAINYGAYSSNPDATMDESCRRLTEDDPVFAVATFLPHPVFLDCLRKADTVAVSDTYPLAQQAFSDSPNHLYSPGTPSFEHAVVGEVDLFRGTDYFTSNRGAVGLLAPDRPEFRSAAAALKRALRTRGIGVDAEVYADTSDASATSRAASAAVLRFSQRNVTKLLVVDSGGLLTLQFMHAAESQQYRPRYGLTSGSLPRTIAPLAPATQLKGAITASWTPYDTDRDEEQPPAVPDTRRLCQEIFRSAGVDTSDRNAEATAVSLCGDVLFLREALTRAVAVNSGALRRVADGLGTRFTSPMTFRTNLSQDRHDGARLLRLTAWDAAGSRWRYSGRTAPS